MSSNQPKSASDPLPEKGWAYSWYFRGAMLVLAAVCIFIGTGHIALSSDLDNLASTRANYAAGLAGLERFEAEVKGMSAFHPAEGQVGPDPTDSAVSDQISADGALVTYYSSASSNALDIAIALYTGGLAVLIIGCRPSPMAYRQAKREAEKRRATATIQT